MGTCEFFPPYEMMPANANVLSFEKINWYVICLNHPYDVWPVYVSHHRHPRDTITICWRPKNTECQKAIYIYEDWWEDTAAQKCCVNSRDSLFLNWSSLTKVHISHFNWSDTCSWISRYRKDVEDLMSGNFTTKLNSFYNDL